MLCIAIVGGAVVPPMYGGLAEADRGADGTYYTQRATFMLLFTKP